MSNESTPAIATSEYVQTKVITHKSIEIVLTYILTWIQKIKGEYGQDLRILSVTIAFSGNAKNWVATVSWMDMKEMPE